MSFEIGQTVVYPHHGAAKIEEISTRMIRGEEKIYLTLRVSQGDLTIQVPAENVDLVGVRDVVDEDGLETVLSVLRAPYIEEPTNWSRRFKANQEKIATGDKRVRSSVQNLLLPAASISPLLLLASMRSLPRATTPPLLSQTTSRKTIRKSDTDSFRSSFCGNHCRRIG